MGSFWFQGSSICLLLFRSPFTLRISEVIKLLVLNISQLVFPFALFERRPVFISQDFPFRVPQNDALGIPHDVAVGKLQYPPGGIGQDVTVRVRQYIRAGHLQGASSRVHQNIAPGIPQPLVPTISVDHVHLGIFPLFIRSQA